MTLFQDPYFRACVTAKERLLRLANIAKQDAELERMLLFLPAVHIGETTWREMYHKITSWCEAFVA